jgi:hypothetical protein
MAKKGLQRPRFNAICPQEAAKKFWRFIMAGGVSGAVADAIANYKAAAEEAQIKSLNVATEVTKINGDKNAITKISPG